MTQSKNALVELRSAAFTLIERAFAQASKKQRREVYSMPLAELKNRLLQMTDRQFRPDHYGANDLATLVAELAPDFALVQGAGGAIVELQRDTHVRKGAPDGETIDLRRDTNAAPSLYSGRIREDLWSAVIDYKSGNRYVWDVALGRARQAVTNESMPLIPTLTRDDLYKWRYEFVDASKDGLVASDLALAMRWREQGLSTFYLPLPLQPLWNRELSRRVRRRLHEFFRRLPVTTRRGAGDKTDEAISACLALDEQLSEARNRGDLFSVGELHARKCVAKCGETVGAAFASIVASWSSSKGLATEPSSLAELVAGLDAMSEHNAATALISATYRLRKEGLEFPDDARDLAFRLRDPVADIYEIDDRRSPVDTCGAAVSKLEARVFELEGAVDRFMRTTAATAKAASLEILKLSHVLHPMLIPVERGFLRDLEVLIGPAFRKLCEAHERNDNEQVLRRAPEFLQNITSHTPDALDPRRASLLWTRIVAPILEHLSEIVEEAMSRGEAALAPVLEIRNPTTKADLRLADREIVISYALRNSGRGVAYDVSLQGLGNDSSIQVSLAEPIGPFDISPQSEQLVRVRLALLQATPQLVVSICWLCQTTLGKQASFEDKIVVEQQVTEPDWEKLIADPPYSLNPIRKPERLYGRDSALRKLHLAAMSGASTFVWGQKRIGKTSLLQVLAAKLSQRADTSCILLRMGELASLHEGEIARLIAFRLVEHSGADVIVPTEAQFGAGMGRLIAFMELLCRRVPDRKFVVVIDEFDDLDSAFYMGERGKQFVKALRSVSEVGLTFFFLGSERMEAIFRRHQSDLNKWTNIQLDRIDNRTECKALITAPVANAIEFSNDAVEFVMDYCGGNPFYIHNFCYQIFDRCLQEHRTFVDDNDTNVVRHQLLYALGPTNFAHFWEDNPLLEYEERKKAIAENCVALTCIAVLGGRYEALDELLEVQGSLQLSGADRASEGDLRHATDRLIARRVLASTEEGGGFAVSLQIFREWLAENAESKLLPVWMEYREQQRAPQIEPSRVQHDRHSDPGIFVIPEDDLIAVSQRLVYCGKQKDVADIRSWLRQFDDDARIEVAFLLLKRLAEKGFINEGARRLALAKLEEMIKARRLDVGQKVWKVERGRLDNLCLAYVDSEIKSGADTARELRNMIRPGKASAANEIGGWMRSHVGDDPLVVIVDDFAGTGATLSKGLKRLRSSVDPETWHAYMDQGRFSVFLMFAFPEAIQYVRDTCPGVHIVAATIFGDELRACSDEAGIFENEGDRRFTRDVLLQLGRELYPDAPLGFGDLGAIVAFHNAVPNNTLPIFWSNGRVGEKSWKPLFPRA